MSTPEKPDPEQNLTSMDGLLKDNLKLLTLYALGSAGRGFGTLILRKPDGQPDAQLDKDCDSANRAMLDKIYELSHADLEIAVTQEMTTTNSEGKERYRRDRVIPTTQHGFLFHETFVHDETVPAEIYPSGYWETFNVGYIDHLPPSLTAENKAKLADLLDS